MEKNTTIVFAVPVDLLAGLHELVRGDAAKVKGFQPPAEKA